jgi:hypothetical protein
VTLITDQGPRTAAYLDFIDESITADPLNIEASTYIPELFYKHGRNAAAWKHLRHVMKTRSGYPEVSFTCVGNTIAGMMGVWPDAPNVGAATLPRLPDEIDWVEADHVTIGRNDLLIRHDGNRQTTVRNNASATVRVAAGRTVVVQTHGNPEPDLPVPPAPQFLCGTPAAYCAPKPGPACDTSTSASPACDS